MVPHLCFALASLARYGRIVSLVWWHWLSFPLTLIPSAGVRCLRLSLYGLVFSFALGGAIGWAEILDGTVLDTPEGEILVSTTVGKPVHDQIPPNPLVTGAVVRQGWQKREPSEGIYDASYAILGAPWVKDTNPETYQGIYHSFKKALTSQNPVSVQKKKEFIATASQFFLIALSFWLQIPVSLP